ncbi:putative oxidoreductase [Hyphomonas johnsonii MHS-2]|uniref:Putative oxidoreductase n=2 Tax=Hyphomonas johnsonii TaxID=81031 RepID=A0A059FUX0_9PROT|nr:putative oxidoreductase [Hyphomonas johnsonii MHS-2]
MALVGRKLDRLEETANMIGATAETLVLQADVADEAQIEAVFARAVNHYGQLDLLFNNAGTSAPKAAIDMVDLRHFNRVLATNVTGAFLCARAAFRQMKTQDPQGGRIINNGSVSAHVPRPNGAPYTISKHAITGLTRQISLDGRPYNIACGQIDIGNAATGVADNLNAGMLQPDGRTSPEPVMPLASVAEAVRCMAGLPLDSNIQFMTIMATQMPFIGRG